VPTPSALGKEWKWMKGRKEGGDKGRNGKEEKDEGWGEMEGERGSERVGWEWKTGTRVSMDGSEKERESDYGREKDFKLRAGEKSANK
jgi:hypothetical protein